MSYKRKSKIKLDIRADRDVSFIEIVQFFMFNYKKHIVYRFSSSGIREKFVPPRFVNNFIDIKVHIAPGLLN